MGFIFQTTPSGQDTATGSIPLRTVILQPSSPDAHSFATKENTAFIRWLASDVVVRRGCSVECSPDSVAPDSASSQVLQDSTEGAPLSFQVISTEPVQQGRVEEGLTQVVILPWTSSPTEDELEFEGSGSLEDSWEIDESFLSGTVSRMAGTPYWTIPVYSSQMSSFKAGNAHCMHLR